MSPRPRKRGNKDLPKNLYSYTNGFVYRHPQTGRRHGMGTDRKQAIAAANILNQRLQSSSDLVAKVIGGVSVSEVISRFRGEYLPEKNHSARTASEVEYRLRRYDRDFGQTSWEGLTLAKLSDWLKPLTREAYRKHRAQWIEIFRFACSVGIADKNIAELTLAKSPQKRVRKRWTEAQYKAARDGADQWLQIAMDLAVLTLQRREDLVNMRFDDIVDGRLLVTQSKTGKRLAIRIGGDLEALIKRAKSRSIVCPYIIARRPIKERRSKTGNSDTHPFQVEAGYLTRAITKARDAATDANGSSLFAGYAQGEHPTLHELRSFGAHLYREAGYPEDYIQALLGHETAKMTTHYLDGHKIEYDEVSADLAL